MADPANVRRVVVAIDPAGARPAPIELGARLAHEAGLALTALVVEEERFLRLASLPFTQEFRLTSGSWGSFEPADVERTFREHARRVERLLLEASRRFDVVAELAVERGAFPRRALEVSVAADLLVVDRAPRLRAGTTRYRRVAVPFGADDADAPAPALRAAARLAAATGLPLRVLLQADGPARLRQLRTAIEAQLATAADGRGAAPLRPEIVSIAASGAQRAEWLRRALDEDDTTLLVLPDSVDGPGLAPDTARMCSAAGCAVVLVRRGW